MHFAYYSGFQKKDCLTAPWETQTWKDGTAAEGSVPNPSSTTPYPKDTSPMAKHCCVMWPNEPAFQTKTYGTKGRKQKRKGIKGPSKSINAKVCFS